MRFRFLLPVLFLGTLCCAQDETITTLETGGKITDGDKNLEGVAVYALIDNVRVDSMVTKANGKFGLMLALQKEHMLEFRKDGYVSKRVLIDLRMKVRPNAEVVLAPIDMDISLLDEAHYEGADTDVLDFPSAIVRWDKGLNGFAMDHEYTMGMARANGSVLLMAARTGTGKNK